MQIRSRVPMIAVTAVVLAMTTAAGAGAAVMKPPVIKETFTPLGCPQAKTTLGAEGCAERQIIRSDKTIDALNAKIFDRLDTSGKRDFVSGHNAWLKYRTAYCRSESDIYQGGTEAGVLAAQCTANLNRLHAQDLRSFLSSLDRN
jgi:uncharacterized protein YecT (DUF1311 family)